MSMRVYVPVLTLSRVVFRKKSDAFLHTLNVSFLTRAEKNYTLNEAIFDLFAKRVRSAVFNRALVLPMTHFGRVWDSSASGNSNLFPGTYRRKWRPSNWLHRRFYRVVYPGPSKLCATLLAGAKVHAEGGRTDSTQRVTSDALHVLVTFLE